MCVILACKAKKPSREILEKCYADNDDGAGIAWFTTTDGKFVTAEDLTKGTKLVAKYKKGLSESEVISMVETLPLPFVIHFRASSVGGKNTLLTHPFEITKESVLRTEGEAEKLLVHNGTFSDWKICLAAKGLSEANEPMSDTRAIAMIASDDNDSFVKKINRGKFVIIDAARQLFRLIGDTFIEEDGILYSNLSWKSKVVHRGPVVASPVGPNSNNFNSATSSAETRAVELPPGSWDETLSRISQKKKLTAGIVITNTIKDGIVTPCVLHTRRSESMQPLDDNASTEERLLRLQFFEFDKTWSNKSRKTAFKKFCRRHNIPFEHENWRGWCGIKDKRRDYSETGLRFAVNAELLHNLVMPA